MAITFLHTADIHFGMENYGHIDQKTGLHTRLLDFKKSFEFCVNYAIDNKLDCFVFAGDAYKNCYPTPTQQRILLKLFLKLLENNIPVIIVVGNHDHPGNFSKAHALDVFYHIKHPLCSIFSKPGSGCIHTKSGPLQVIGIPWMSAGNISKGRKISSKEIKEHIISEITKFKKKLDDSLPSILVGHLTMEAGVFSGSEKSIIEGKDPLFKISDFSPFNFNYIALGHLHKYQYINEKYPEQSPIVYSGSPDRIDFGEKKDNKSFCVVTVDTKRKTNFIVVAIPCRFFYEISIHIDSLETLELTINTEIKKYESLESAIIKIKYSYNYQYIKYIDISFLEKFFSNIWHIASIECINNYKVKKKETSLVLHEEKNFESMVAKYIESKEEYKNKKEEYLVILKEYINKQL